MTFHEKLQQLRKEKGLTQAQLAEAIYVSRTAISKWESGRGYPNLDSLKALAVFFGVTTDDLLLAQNADKKSARMPRDRAFALLDCSAALLFIVPLFARRAGNTLQTVSLLALSGNTPAVWAAQIAAVVALALWGALGFLSRGRISAPWMRWGSLLLNGFGALLFSLCLQPYAAAFLFLLLAAKAFLLARGR